MRISNNYSKEGIQPLAKKIWKTIKQEPMLTSRTYSEIENALMKKNIHILYEGEKIIGFIGKRNLHRRWYELMSLYIHPHYRKRGYARYLLKSSHVDNNYFYIAGTFQDYIVRILKDQGFQHVSLSDLPVPVLFSYILSRDIRSVLLNFTKKKAHILVKNN